MWSDTLLAAEQMHLVRLLIWGGLSIVTGGVLFALVATKRLQSSLIRHFAIQTVAWGAVALAFAGYGWSGLALRDHAGAVHLDRLAWLNIGLDLGYAGIGATLAITGWTLGRRLGAVGAGIAIVVQGLAFMLLDLQLGAAIVR